MSIIQNPEDLANLKHSCLILMSCLNMVEQNAKVGVSCGKLNKLAIEFIQDHQARPSFLGLYGYPYALISELNEEVVHGMSPDSKIIPDSCVISFDCGVEYKGLFSDACILLTIGEVSNQARILVEKTKEACYAGIKQVKAGNRVGDIGFAANEVISKAGLGNVLELGGHGLGYKPHDEPHIMHKGQKGKGARLFENQVIAIEPMVTLGSGKVDFIKAQESDLEIVVTKERCLAAHFEHTVLVTKKGYEILTEIPKDKMLK